MFGFVKQDTVGTELDVPVPRKIISTTLAIDECSAGRSNVIVDVDDEII